MPGCCEFGYAEFGYGDQDVGHDEKFFMQNAVESGRFGSMDDLVSDVEAYIAERMAGQAVSENGHPKEDGREGPRLYPGALPVVLAAMVR